ncbi:transcription repressor myb5 [Anaeramoeba flamelloides]|uniref:Transcription repressor myb5 n=1 Tax=Anaeramoeba flamelloides TaxID=1746091 RepID=A0AAV7YBZ2_9EUKA|nr:transcription repressor myb5 [Anaeramoeba flamelloides]
MFDQVLQKKVNKLKKDIKKISQLAPLKPHKNTIWSREEDDILSRAVTKYKGRDWENVAKYFENKDATQCLHRWQKVLNPNLKKGKWTEEEDKLLKKYVKLFGDSKWSKVADSIPRRTSKQCRERWKNQLDPRIKTTPWTKEEDKILIEKHKEFGNKWSKIKEFLPGRPDNRIKNRWNSTLKKIVHGLPASQSNKLRKRGRPKGSTTNKNKKQKKIIIHIGREKKKILNLRGNKEYENTNEIKIKSKKEEEEKEKEEEVVVVVRGEEREKGEKGDMIETETKNNFEKGGKIIRMKSFKTTTTLDHIMPFKGSENKNDSKNHKSGYELEKGIISLHMNHSEHKKKRRRRRRKSKLKHKRKSSNSHLTFSDSNNESFFSTKSETGSESKLVRKNKFEREQDSEFHSISSMDENKYNRDKRKKKHRNKSKSKSSSRCKSKRKHKKDSKKKSKIQLKKSRNKSKNELNREKITNCRHTQNKKKMKSKHKSRLNQIKKHQMIKTNQDREMVSRSPKKEDLFFNLDPDLSPISLSKKISQIEKDQDEGQIGKELIIAEDVDGAVGGNKKKRSKEMGTEDKDEGGGKEEEEEEEMGGSSYRNYLQSTPLRNQQFTPFLKYNKMYTPIYNTPDQNAYGSGFSSFVSTPNNYPMILNLEEANEQFSQYGENTPLSWEKSKRVRPSPSNNEEDHLIIGHNKTPNYKIGLGTDKPLRGIFSPNKPQGLHKNKKCKEERLHPNGNSSSQEDCIYSPNLIFDPLSTSPMTPKFKYTNSNRKKRKTFLMNSLQKVSQNPLQTPVSLEKLSYHFGNGSTPNVDSPSKLSFKSPSWLLSPPAKVNQKKIKKRVTMQANATTLFCSLSSYTLSPKKK